MNEAELIAGARNGDQDAFTALHKEHLPAVKAVGRAILRTDDLDDLCQETFLLAFMRISSFQENSNFRTWVTRIAINQCLMVLRRNGQVTNGSSRLLQLDAEMVSGELLDQCFFTTEDKNLRSIEARLDLPKYLQILKPAQREMLEMAYLEDLQDMEIATRMGVTIASVKSKIHHAKKRVAKHAKNVKYTKRMELPVLNSHLKQ